jgi:hypothetical protein
MHSRTITHVVLAGLLVLVVVLGVVTLASRPAAPASCVRNGDYGTQCESLAGNRLKVTGLEARLTWAPDVFDQHEWTFATTIYRCDPRGRTKAECAPAQTAYGSLHARTPHGTAEVVCSRAGEPIGGKSTCTATLGVALPQTFPDARWVCTEFAVRVNGKWLDNGAALSNGLRACLHVH